MKSLPLRERGLKSTVYQIQRNLEYVAPLAGAWIEIIFMKQVLMIERVAPLAGAWIEIRKQIYVCRTIRSLPLRERGLKYRYYN